MHYTVSRVDIHDTGFDQAVEVEFEVNGKYYPATMTEPEEHPEIEVLKVTYDGECVVDSLSGDQLEQIGIDCWESLGD